MSDPFAPAAADTQSQHLNPSRSARLGRYLMTEGRVKRPILLLTLTAALWSKALGSLLILTGWWLLKTL